MPNKKDSTNYVKINQEEEVKEIITSAIGGLWDIVNDLTRLKPTKRERFHVSIFGSARVARGSLYYNEVRKLARALAEMDCNIITGGGPGLMQAANEGAAEVDKGKIDRSVGIRIDLPFEQDANPFVQEAFEHKTFFTRLHHFVITSDAFVVVPGGIGTVLEAMMVWQLLQVRHVHDTPLIFVGKMWEELIDWAKRNMLEKENKLASPEDFNIPVCVDNAEEIIEIIQEHQNKWANS